MSKRAPAGKKEKRAKPRPPTIAEPGDITKDGTFDRASKMGLLMDPRTETTPEQMRQVTDEMLELGMLENVVLLTGPAAGEAYGPTKQFLDMFLQVRRQYLKQARTEKDRESATYQALASTVGHILDEVQPTVDRAVMLAKHLNYYFTMAIYMSQPGIGEKLGIDGWDLFPPIYKEKAMAGMEREAKKAGR